MSFWVLEATYSTSGHTAPTHFPIDEEGCQL